MFKDHNVLAYVAAGLGLIALVVWIDLSGYVPFAANSADRADRSANHFHK